MAVSQKQSDFIKSYFKMLKIRNATDNKQFWDMLFNRYDKNMVNNLLKIVVERPEKSITEPHMPDIYNIKNQSLDLSLDFCRMTCDLHTQYLQWFVEVVDITPERILDIGCDNGIVTCFYAILFPESEVIGIDICENGISCATLLAEKLKLSNITFRKNTIEELCEYYPIGHFDLITTLTTAKEIAGSIFCELVAHPDKYNYWCLEDLPLTVNFGGVEKLLSSIEKLLSPRGRYLSFERWFAEDSIWWSEKLKDAGLYISWEESKTLCFKEVGLKRGFPAFIADKTLRQFDSKQNTADLWLKNEVMDPQKRSEYEGLPAEIMFKKFIHKDFVGGVQCNYSKSSLKIRYEVWKTDKLMLFYQSSSSGYRELKIMPVQSDDLVKQMLLNLKQHHFQNGYKTFYYKNYHDIDKFN